MEQLFDILPSEWAERFLETEKERIELHFKDVGKLSLLQSKAWWAWLLAERAWLSSDRRR